MKLKRIVAFCCAAAMLSVMFLSGCQNKEIEKVDHGVIRIAYNLSLIHISEPTRRS